MLIIGVGILVAVMRCASTQDRERRALSEEFDKWLGQYKDTRIIERGPPAVWQTIKDTFDDMKFTPIGSQ